MATPGKTAQPASADQNKEEQSSAATTAQQTDALEISDDDKFGTDPYNSAIRFVGTVSSRD